MNPSRMPMDDCDSLMTCPYFKSHQVTASRMAFHLTKCQYVHKVNNKKAMGRCIYNAMHHVQLSDLFGHLETCDDRRLVETRLTSSQGQDQQVIQPYVAPPLPTGGESWDLLDEPTYDPQVKAIHAPVLRSLQGATKSQRKRHRNTERKRLQILRDGDHVENFTRMGNIVEAVEPVILPPLEIKHAYDVRKSLRKPRARSHTFIVPQQQDPDAPRVIGRRFPPPGQGPTEDDKMDQWGTRMLHAVMHQYRCPEGWLFEIKADDRVPYLPAGYVPPADFSLPEEAAQSNRRRTRTLPGPQDDKQE